MFPKIFSSPRNFFKGRDLIFKGIRVKLIPLEWQVIWLWLRPQQIAWRRQSANQLSPNNRGLRYRL
jgi:hypothetical protein